MRQLVRAWQDGRPPSGVRACVRNAQPRAMELMQMSPWTAGYAAAAKATSRAGVQNWGWLTPRGGGVALTPPSSPDIAQRQRVQVADGLLTRRGLPAAPWPGRVITLLMSTSGVPVKQASLRRRAGTSLNFTVKSTIRTYLPYSRYVQS